MIVDFIRLKAFHKRSPHGFRHFETNYFFPPLSVWKSHILTPHPIQTQIKRNVSYESTFHCDYDANIGTYSFKFIKKQKKTKKNQCISYGGVLLGKLVTVPCDRNFRQSTYIFTANPFSYFKTGNCVCRVVPLHVSQALY